MYLKKSYFYTNLIKWLIFGCLFTTKFWTQTRIWNVMQVKKDFILRAKKKYFNKKKEKFAFFSYFCL